MTISNELIEKAEKILLPPGKTFDDERRSFIKGLDNRDLMAVPGSGKTTALQAKLFCMAQHMPLKNDSGILVLSHTNTAVDELKRLLLEPCPQLFEYPNFVGTIQQFVDNFLAIPYYETCTGKSIEFIDSDKYYKECDKYVNTKRGLAANHVKYHFANENKHYNQIRFSHNETGQIVITLGLNGKKPTINVPQTWRKANKEEENTCAVFTFLEKMKKYLLNNGYLHYDDCYFLAESYIINKPSIIHILRERFKYIFVDEAQDTQKHQLNILNTLFGGEPCECYQLIGDPNQSIFSNHSRNTTLQWVGKSPRYINKSIRLTSSVSSVVNSLVLDKGHEEGVEDDHFCVVGLRTPPESIPPHLILFDVKSMRLLKDRFQELIRQYHLIDEDSVSKNGFHIIGWAAKKTGDINKLHLEDIFPEYNYSSNGSVATADTLCRVVQINNQNGNFDLAHKIVIDSFLHVLYLCGAKAEDGRGYNKTKLLKTLNGITERSRDIFNNDLYNCTKELAIGNDEQAYCQIKKFITYWIQTLYNIQGNERSQAYIGDDYIRESIIPVVNANKDVIPITIETIHSSKGRTHCATMYVETFYEGKYEIEHLMVTRREGTKNPLFGDDVVNKGTYATLARKMMYVGFSRPTHLLCYASERKRWTDDSLEKMKNQGWEIIDMTIE